MDRSNQKFPKAIPLDNHSCLAELSITNWMGWGIWPKLSKYVQHDFNIETPLKRHPQAFLVFKTIDADLPSLPGKSFSITDILRWRLDITRYSTFEQFLDSLKRWHRCNYKKSKKMFEEYGATVTFIDENWSCYAEEVYTLYSNVAAQHEDKLYDLSFFQTVAERGDYPLICAWFQGKMIGMFVLQKEPNTLHSICCGMDYYHSTKCYGYSWLNFELIRYAIQSKKYTTVDVGLSANSSKEVIGFKAIPCRMDIYARGIFGHYLLRGLSRFIRATITTEGQMEFNP